MPNGKYPRPEGFNQPKSWRCLRLAQLIRRTVPVSEAESASIVAAAVEVDVGIGDFVPRGAVSNDEQHDVLGRPIDKAVSIAGAGRKAGTHARCQCLSTGVGFEHDLAFNHIDELVLLRMRMPVGGLSARHDPGQVHAIVPQAGVVAKTTVVAVQVGAA